jgi:uncharacterized protein (DUF2147 family)
MKHLTRILLLLSILCGLTAYAQQSGDGIAGNWITGTGEAKVNIFKTGNQYYGSIVWLKNPLENGKPKVDRNNPEEKLRTRPLLGLLLLRGFTYEGDNVWVDGKIYDPKNGKDYSCKITLNGEGKLEVRGFIGISLIGRTDTWTKAQ